jgi:hypothetical protein
VVYPFYWLFIVPASSGRFQSWERGLASFSAFQAVIGDLIALPLAHFGEKQLAIDDSSEDFARGAFPPLQFPAPGIGNSDQTVHRLTILSTATK